MRLTVVSAGCAGQDKTKNKKMEAIQEFELIGIALPKRTTNENGQAAIDCGNLWQEFTSGDYASKVEEKISNEVFAVYHEYESDHTKPYSFFIGVKVKPGTKVPEGMNGLIIPAGAYEKRTAIGKMPDCIADCWIGIWNSDLDRAYRPDFEVYGAKSADWENAEVDVFVSVIDK